MQTFFSQTSYQVFLHMLWVFFLIGSLFGLAVGLGLATRSPIMLRACKVMNRWISVRQLMKPIAQPYFVEPVLMKRPVLLGSVITPCALTSAFLINELPADAFQPVYLGLMNSLSAEAVSHYTKWFLLIGNALCILIGVSLIFAPQILSRLERYTDFWFSLRQRTKVLAEMHHQPDEWVLAHPTISGITLIVLSLGLAVVMSLRIWG